MVHVLSDLTALTLMTSGTYLMSLGGEILYANQKWYEITDYNKYENEQKPMSWMTTIAEDSQVTAMQEWNTLLKDHRQRSCELRLRKEWKATDPVTGEMVRSPTHVLAAAAIQNIGGTDYVTGW